MGQNFCSLTNKQDRIGGRGGGDLQKMTTSKNLMTYHISNRKEEGWRLIWRKHCHQSTFLLASTT